MAQRELALQECPAVALTPKSIGHAATLALYDELALSPKPGLVTLIDNGSHDDMDANTFLRSIFSLSSYFEKIAELGARGENFESLERLGIAAEKRMLAATGGINTHRGALFTLGLICAAAGALAVGGQSPHPDHLRQTLLKNWGAALSDRALRQPKLPGGIAARLYGLRSASEEASLGFPVIFNIALPAMQNGTSCGLPRQHVLLDTLFHVMSVIDDSNLAHRGGMEGLHFARHSARDFLAAGGTSAPTGIAYAIKISEDFVERRLSPGGAADMLAAACLITRLQSI